MLEVKDTYWHSKVSYLDLHLETDNGGRLKAQLYDKRDEFTFPIPVVNFLSPVSIFQQHQHTEFTFHNSYVILGLEPSTVIFRTELLKLDNVAPSLKSSLHKLYGRHHYLVDRYTIFISQMTMKLFFLRIFFLSSITDKTILLSNFTIYKHDGCIKRSINYLLFACTWVHLGFLVGSVFLIVFCLFLFSVLPYSIFLFS